MNYPKRFETCLVNPTWEEMISREPLLAFSNYLSGRANVLFRTAEEILKNLDAAESNEVRQSHHFERADALMWLWTLGAYEVVRTMCQAHTCFSEKILKDLRYLRKELADIRMPAAKMEKKGKSEPVSSNRSPSGWNPEGNDILLFRSDPDSYLSARAILDDFDRVFCSISKDDIRKRHENSYEVKHNKRTEGNG